jgi:hypothetical protein
MSIFDNKNSIWNILGLKIQTVETCSSASSTHRNFYFWKTLKSRFLVVFQSFVFGQILANFGSFEQFWAVFAALTVADSMPKLGWNLKNFIAFEPWAQMLHVASHWKATIHIYILKKFQKIQKIIAFTAACPKMQEAVLAPLVL